jgi:hypothetical protein
MYTASELRPVTAGPDGDRGSNSNHSGALLRAMTSRSVSIPVPDHLPSRQICPFRQVKRVRAGRFLSGGQLGRAIAIPFFFGEQSPNDASGLGGERHHDDLVGSSCEQIAQPRILDAACTLIAQM